MDRAMREYVRRWAFKHPTPAISSARSRTCQARTSRGSGTRSSTAPDVLDIAVDSVSMRQSDGQTIAEIQLRRVTSIPVPSDDAAQAQRSNRRRTCSCPSTSGHAPIATRPTIPVTRPVVGARLWPDPNVPDWNAGERHLGRRTRRPTSAAGSTAGGTRRRSPAPDSRRHAAEGTCR